MAQRKRRRKSRRQTRQQPEYPGWLWMLFGLALGLAVAFAVYVKDRRPVVVAETPVSQPASLQDALDDNSETEAATEQPVEESESRFTFYDMLPKFEVVIPEEEPDVAVDAEPQAIVEPGLYVLQAGSFTLARWS